MLPEDPDPSLLVGYTVVEAGRRQAWPFLGLLDGSGTREVRLYVDSDLIVGGFAKRILNQDDDTVLLALSQVVDAVVCEAVVDDDGTLTVRMSEGSSVTVKGVGNSLTTAAPWWFGLVSDSAN